MTVARIAISLDRELAQALRKAAKGEALSTWIADAARRKLRAEGLVRLIGEWEAEHGELTQTELEAAAKARSATQAPKKRRRKRAAPKTERARSTRRATRRR